MQAHELSWQAIQAIVGVQLSVDLLRFDDMGWHLSAAPADRHRRSDSDVEIIEDDSDGDPPPDPLPPLPPPSLSPQSDAPSSKDEPPRPDDDNDNDDLSAENDNGLSIDDYLEVTLSTDSENSHTCPKCDRIFPAEAELTAHECLPPRPRKPDEDKKHGCHVCVEKFTNYWELRKHINTHFPGMLDSKSSFCHLCQKDYTKTGFMNHLRKHTGERPFVCELCHKAFSQSSSLSIHMKFHLNVRKHACTVCEKKFVTKSELSRHMTVHTKQKSYYCGVCDKAFTRSDNMKKHEKTHG